MNVFTYVFVALLLNVLRLKRLEAGSDKLKEVDHKSELYLVKVYKKNQNFLLLCICIPGNDRRPNYIRTHFIHFMTVFSQCDCECEISCAHKAHFQSRCALNAHF